MNVSFGRSPWEVLLLVSFQRRPLFMSYLDVRTFWANKLHRFFRRPAVPLSTWQQQPVNSLAHPPTHHSVKSINLTTYTASFCKFFAQGWAFCVPEICYWSVFFHRLKLKLKLRQRKWIKFRNADENYNWKSLIFVDETKTMTKIRPNNGN